MQTTRVVCTDFAEVLTLGNYLICFLAPIQYFRLTLKAHETAEIHRIRAVPELMFGTALPAIVYKYLLSLELIK